MAIKVSNVTVIDDSKKFFPVSMAETKIAMAANNIDLATGIYFTKTISTATTLTVSNVYNSGLASKS